MSKKIFTFWEPKEAMPAYLRLCMKTWEKFLPEYEIIILDYSNLYKWLGENFYDKILYKNFSLPKQADAIRCALLNKYGGIWLDTDTIFTSNNIKKFLSINTETIFLGKHIGFIISKPQAYILEQWEEKIKQKIFVFKNFYSNPINRILHPKKSKEYKNWDYLGNSILNKYFDILSEEKVFCIDENEICALPENIWKEKNNLQLSNTKNYKQFYFKNDYSNYVLENNKGIIYLHNSWTPDEFKRMSEKDFLGQNCTLSLVLKKVLEF